jgi:CRISPR-associated protein Csm5
MRYRVTALTPLLVGDGGKLSPIDYMVWKDQVNVLDQNRIFKLLAKGPRLDGYLTQIRKAERLDFASWGGFAQNFADRRISFEHPSLTGHWQRAATEAVHIPTFAVGASGPYLPAASLKGALRTGVLFATVRDGSLKDLAQKVATDRLPRHPAENIEQLVLGQPGRNRMRAVAASDSSPVPHAVMKIYLLRVATLAAKAGGFALGWKPNPVFAEMAVPGTVFEGAWQERSPGPRAKIFDAANQHAARMLELHKQYAQWTGLDLLAAELEALESKLASIDRSAACLLSIGWGGGFLSKSGWLGKDGDEHRAILKTLPFYQRAINSGLPFPKTRRVVFREDKPSTLPGWVLLEVAP